MKSNYSAAIQVTSAGKNVVHLWGELDLRREQGSFQ